jgi:hypothetical protein
VWPNAKDNARVCGRREMDMNRGRRVYAPETYRIGSVSDTP